MMNSKRQKVIARIFMLALAACLLSPAPTFAQYQRDDQRRDRRDRRQDRRDDRRDERQDRREARWGTVMMAILTWAVLSNSGRPH